MRVIGERLQGRTEGSVRKGGSYFIRNQYLSLRCPPCQHSATWMWPRGGDGLVFPGLELHQMGVREVQRGKGVGKIAQV